MGSNRRVDLRGILAKSDLRRELMLRTLQATQAREGIETTREQAERAYYVVTEAENAASSTSSGSGPGRFSPIDDTRCSFGRLSMAKNRCDSTLPGATSPPSTDRRWRTGMSGLWHTCFASIPALEPGHARTRSWCLHRK